MPDTYKGVEETLIKRDNGRPFEVNTYTCPNCGSKDDYADDDHTCHRCGRVLDTRDKSARTISKGETKAIIDNTLVYTCPICKKQYNVPTYCCGTEGFAVENHPMKGKSRVEYLCTGCNRRFIEPVRCCPGSMMVEGRTFSEMTMKEFSKIRSGLSTPIKGVMQ